MRFFKMQLGINSLGVLVRALQIMAAEGDATANEVIEDRAPLSVDFSFYNAFDFALAFALEHGHCGVAGTVFPK